MTRTTSPQGRAALVREEGDVLRAYKDAVGRWTIGAGLTSASGVVDPKYGMVITKEQSDALLTEALTRNYEPAVRAAMPAAAQHEFDGGVSFHYNTGAIARASWVKAWARRDWPKVFFGLNAWNKGGGRVLPGLTARREREYRMIRNADYGAEPQQLRRVDLASWALPSSGEEREQVRQQLSHLGYAVGTEPGLVQRVAVVGFQADHRLTPDGIIGRATLSTLQRRIDARGQAAGVMAAGAPGVAGMSSTAVADLAAIPAWVLPALLACVAIWAAWKLWAYRDVVAAKIDGLAPRLAEWLRSI